MRSGTVIVIAGMLAVALGAAAKAAGEPDIHRSYYSISGRNHAEIVSSVRRNGPRNGFAYGIGFIDFLPRYGTEHRDGLCRLTRPEVGLRIHIRLPRWDGGAAAPRTATSIAMRFVRAIESHEMQHAAIARRYAARMKAVLAKLPPQKDCWALRTRADETLVRLKKEHLAAQRAFDVRTNRQIRRLL